MDRNLAIDNQLMEVVCRSLRGNVDRNTSTTSMRLASSGRSLRGNVDRNAAKHITSAITSVVPYVGTWIEISNIHWLLNHQHCRSLRGNVDRN